MKDALRLMFTKLWAKKVIHINKKKYNRKLKHKNNGKEY